MSLPKEILVAGTVYKVESKPYVEFNDNANALGCCTYDKATIEVKSEMSEERVEEVFVHELMRAIMYEAVNRSAKVLYQVLKDNSFDFLRGEQNAP